MWKLSYFSDSKNNVSLTFNFKANIQSHFVSNRTAVLIFWYSSGTANSVTEKNYVQLRILIHGDNFMPNHRVPGQGNDGTINPYLQ